MPTKKKCYLKKKVTAVTDNVVFDLMKLSNITVNNPNQ